MAHLSPADILKLAELSKIQLTQEEVTLFSNELEAILSYIDQLSEVDTSGLAPTIQVNGLSNAMREDKVIDYKVSQSALLKNAPALKDTYIQVKRVLE